MRLARVGGRRRRGGVIDKETEGEGGGGHESCRDPRQEPPHGMLHAEEHTCSRSHTPSRHLTRINLNLEIACMEANQMQPPRPTFPDLGAMAGNW